MVGYANLQQDTKFLVEKLCAQVESMALNEDRGNVLAWGTTAWGLVKALLTHLGDMGASILGADLYARLVAAIAEAEARD